MKKNEYEKKLFSEIGKYLSELNYSWIQEKSEFQAATAFGIDRIYCNLWKSGKEYSFTLAVFRHLSEVEELWSLYGDMLGDTIQDKKMHRTLNTNPKKIKEKTFDLFSMGPQYTFTVELSEQGCETLAQTIKGDFKEYVSPMLDQYNNIAALDQFLHSNIDQLVSDPLKHYLGKAYLVDYNMIYLKSLFIAKLVGNPDQKVIYEAVKGYLLPFTGKGSELDDHMLEVLKKIYAG